MSYGSIPLGTAAPASLRAALDQGALVGTFQLIGHTTVTEALVYAGADAIVVDAEHAALDLTTIEQLVRAGSGRVIVRVPEISSAISRSLDTGAAGIVVPHVESAAQAVALVDAVRFPPLGSRGIGAARAAQYGFGMADYLATANDSLLAIAMVETREGLERVDEIAAVDGLDLIFIGPTDLAASLGTAAGSAEHRAAIGRIIEATLAAGKHVGIHCADAAQAAEYEASGVRLLLVSTDVAFLASTANTSFTDSRR
ncbi:HpcH/HpaI aldolase/citrate lyase family protein [Salinibacterium sp. ZJ450]|uniref:HpcH/HpaI aldolase family protein n=1 Tax=Salinibacterium sp. ZJ450 TaxID=2708338 RepID=UPI00141FB93A|nr:aldolase/citrate lyase family protein [Salinibacterium sp. ZJ450]